MNARSVVAAAASLLFGTLGALAAWAEPLVALAVPPGAQFADALIRFDSATPGSIDRSVPISGLAGSDALVGIQYRPANNTLYGLAVNAEVTRGRLYTVDAATGAAAPVGDPTVFLLNGGFFGFALDPISDVFRFTSDFGQNRSIDPVTGALGGFGAPLSYDARDPNAGADPGVAATAFSNNTLGAVSTAMYSIDFLRDVLSIQTAALELGTLFTVGPMGITTASGYVGFDISAASDAGYVAATETFDAVTRLYTIDLRTGQATEVGPIGSGDNRIDGLTVLPLGAVPVPAPGTAALVLAGLLAASGPRRAWIAAGTW